MSGALNVGTSGLSAAQKQLDVIGNNLANSNTVGFKSADISFASLLSQNLSGGKEAVGEGVIVSGIPTNFAQGTFESTGNATDLAIDGSGFFIVKDGENSLYTRAGGFRVSSDGILQDLSNYSVQGRMYDATGDKEVDALAELNLNGAKSVPSVTTYFGIGATLDSGTTSGDTFTSSQVVYDSSGEKHNLKTIYTKMEHMDYWGTQVFLDNNAAVSQTYAGIKFDSDGAVEKVLTPAFASVTATKAGAGTLTSTVINHAGELTQATTAPLVMTRGAIPDVWTLTGPVTGNYPNAIISSTGTAGIDDVVTIDLDGVGGADITLNIGGAWAANDTISTVITQQPKTTSAAGTITSSVFDNPGAVPQSTAAPLVLTRTSADLWTLTGTAADNYPSAVISSLGTAGADDVVAIDLDGSGAADITINLAGAWLANDTISFSLAHTESTLDNSDVRFYATGKALSNGKTIGTDGVITWNLTKFDGSDAPALQTFAATSRISSLVNNGYALGFLSGLEVGKDGIVTGTFDNGQRQKLARIRLVDFGNLQGLNKQGSYFIETVLSGGAREGQPGDGMGTLRSASLEMSNTDTAKEFIKMITAQRAYQSNAKIISTADQMLQELMNIKR